MRMYDIIRKKRDGGELSREEISFFVKGYTSGEIPDYQASALCMAICFRSMSDRETADLTEAMMRSGDVVDLSAFGELSADKHSTGGVGDKTSLIVAPTVAALGGKMAKMSGRGLGHTGGTIDKLESIPGFRTTLKNEEFLQIAGNVGVCVIGQSAALAPADKKLYALRDVTATIDSIPLIASSIMSKKLAAGAHSIVLDVKCGSGAFMKTQADAELLAKTMISVGKAHGRRVRAVISNMDMPLGKAVGNALEVEEAVGVLTGKIRGDIYDICVELASNIVAMVKGVDISSARAMVKDCIDSGAAFDKMKEWAAAQGGDTRALDDVSLLPHAPYVEDIIADRDGYIGKTDTESIGIAASMLGAGRTKKEDVIDLSAGIEVFAKTGDAVKRGDVIAKMYASNGALFEAARQKYLSSFEISKEFVEKPKLILNVIE